MKFDFDKVIDRRGTGSLKWDVPENELPMWVADMDFQTAPCIREALAARVELRSHPSHINGGEKAHHTCRECGGADPCLQYFL